MQISHIAIHDKTVRNSSLFLSKNKGMYKPMLKPMYKGRCKQKKKKVKEIKSKPKRI